MVTLFPQSQTHKLATFFEASPHCIVLITVKFPNFFPVRSLCLPQPHDFDRPLSKLVECTNLFVVPQSQSQINLYFLFFIFLIPVTVYLPIFCPT